MTGIARRVADPTAQQPSKAGLERNVTIDAAPDSLAWTFTHTDATCGVESGYLPQTKSFTL